MELVNDGPVTIILSDESQSSAREHEPALNTNHIDVRSIEVVRRWTSVTNPIAIL